MEEFKIEKGAYKLDSIEDYIRFNSRVAIRIYKHFENIKNNKERFYKIARCGLPLAQRTTAGAMILFYENIIV